jgi:hypothetical protein
MLIGASCFFRLSSRHTFGTVSASRRADAIRFTTGEETGTAQKNRSARLLPLELTK